MRQGKFRRLKALEHQERDRSEKRAIRVLFESDAVRCPEHRDCDIEIETGEHHQGVSHLRFGEGRA
jgi:hypothetical protein